jgi:hypothetical protein
MIDTIRENIIQEWPIRAALIRTDGSPQEYATDCGRNVLRAAKPYDEREVPCTVIWPGDEKAESKNGMVLNHMEIDVEALHFFGKKAIEKGYATIEESASVVSERVFGDLKRCFGSKLWDRRRPLEGSPVVYQPPYATSIVYQGGGPSEYEMDNGTIVVGAITKFIVSYWTKIGDPYTQ